MGKNKVILPPTYLWVLVLITIGLWVVVPGGIIIAYPFNILGLGLVVFGVAVNIQADGMFKKRGTTVKPFGKPAVLITDGPFGFSRHPMYLGFVAILLGLAVYLQKAILLVTPAVMFYILETRFISEEEENLEKIFGQAYINYKGRVRKWL
jgi:protein-S-isoprenylcysteine O-methyltransferase Ste14